MPIKFPSLGFGGKPRSGPGLAVTSQGHTRFRTSPDKGIGLNPPDHQLVLSRWRRLGSLSPKSHDYQELLGTLVDTEGDGKVALELAGNDAQIVINIIDEVSPPSDMTLPYLIRRFFRWTPAPEERGASKEACPLRPLHTSEAR